MSPPDLAVVPPARRFAVALLAGSAFLFACDRPPTELDRSDRLAPDGPAAELVDFSDPTVCGVGRKSFSAVVTMPNGAPAPYTVMTISDPVRGLICFDDLSDGVLEVTGLERGQRIYPAFRYQLGPEFPYLLIWPLSPQLDFAALDLASFLPTPAVSPRILSGEDCTETRDFVPDWYYAATEPCVVPGSGFKDVPVQYSGAHAVTIDVTVTNPDGDPVGGALASVLTPFDCGQVVDDFGGLCTTQNVKAPAFVQSTAFSSSVAGEEGEATLTASTATGVDGVNPLFLEAVWSEIDVNDVLQTYVWSGAATAAGAVTGYASNLICEETVVVDVSDPSSTDFDIKQVVYGYGGIVGTPADATGLRSSSLEWVESKVVVVLTLENISGELPQDGEIKFRFRDTVGGGNKTASADFGLDASGECFITPLSGNAVDALGLTLTDGCREVDGQWEYHFVIDGVPSTQAVSFTAKTHDTIDPSRNDLSSAQFLIEQPELISVPGYDELQCRWGESTLGDGSRWRIGG